MTDTPKVILGVSIATSEWKCFLEADLSDFAKLYQFLDKVSVFHCDITEPGIEYLRQLGLRRIAVELEKLGGFPDFGYRAADEIHDFLTKLEPNAAREIAAAHRKHYKPTSETGKVQEPCPICGHERGPHAFVTNNHQKPLYRRGFYFCPIESCNCIGTWTVDTGSNPTR